MATKRIIALDISTSCMGACFARNGDFIDACYYQPKTTQDAWDRVSDMANWLMDKLKDFQPDVLIIEFPSGVHNNMDTNVKVGFAFGEMLTTFRYWFDYQGLERGQEVVVRPTEVKATGYHKNDFGKAEELIGKKLEWDTKAEKDRLGNMVDAIGVWKAGAKQIEW